MLFFKETNTLEETHVELCESLKELHQYNESTVIFSESSDFAFLNENSEGVLQKLSNKLEKVWDAFVEWIKNIFDKVKELGEKLKQQYYKVNGKKAVLFKLRSTPEVINKLVTILKSAKFTDKASCESTISKLQEFDSYYSSLGDKTKEVSITYFVNTSAEKVVSPVKPIFSKLEATKKQLSNKFKAKLSNEQLVEQQFEIRALVASINLTRKVVNNVYSDYTFGIKGINVSKKAELDNGDQYK